MPIIEDPKRARRLARAIASDIVLYSGDRARGQPADAIRETLAKEIEEGRQLFEARAAPPLLEQGLFEQAIDEVVIGPLSGSPGTASGSPGTASGSALGSASTAGAPPAPQPRPMGSGSLRDLKAAELRITNAQLRGDSAAAAQASQDLRAMVADYQDASRYRANLSSSLLGLAIAVVGLGLCIFGGMGALSGRSNDLLGLVPGVILLALGGSLAYSCLSWRARALPPRALRTTGVPGQARLLEVLAERGSVGWSNSGTSGTLYKWRIEVTLPGQAPYEAVVETFRDLPRANAPFPVFVDPDNAAKMYIGQTHPR